MRFIAYLLYAVGLGGGVSAAAKLPAAGDRFPDTLPAFVIAAVAATVGLVLWRMDLAQQRELRTSQEGSQPDSENAPSRLLDTLVAAAQQLQSESPILDAASIEHRVEALLEQYALPFVEARQTVLDQFGMAKGAEILVTFSVGERMLNRTWSAAADGHLPESRSSLPEAVRALEEAARQMHAE